MGTKIYGESYFSGHQYHSLRNSNEIQTNSNWPIFFGNKTIQNGQHCNGNLPGTVTNLFSGYEKETVKQMMLTHEAAFKHQVSELHRLYKVQKEIMNDIKRTELYKQHIRIDTPPSSSSLLYRSPYEDALMRWQRSPLPVIDFNNYEILDSRPSKARKKLFDLHLSGDNYIDLEDEKTVVENNISDISSNSCTRNNKADSKVQFFDLNEPFRDDGADAILMNNFLQKSIIERGRIFDMNVAGPQATEPVDSKSLKNPGTNLTFSKLLSDEILKANNSCNNDEITKELIDINLVCDIDAEAAVKEKEKIAANFERYIDLNLCASEDEITLVPSCGSTNIDVNIALDIDLEVSALADLVEDTSTGDEADLFAAMSIVAISSYNNNDILEKNTCDPSESSSEDTLFWFSKIASFYSENPEKNVENASDVRDEFVEMTLRLTELKEEEYMPISTPLFSENMEKESPLPRRGKSRRERRKRDFQREILPGLGSLSRHEVAEDVQTYGRIMREMGHSWPVISKRGSGGRRRRLVVEPIMTYKPLIEQNNSIEIGLEKRVLTGWGKTPRRPRRRRSNVGNLSNFSVAKS